MNPEDLPPSAFVLAHYDDIHRPCGGIAEDMGGGVCRTRNAEGGTRNESRTPSTHLDGVAFGPRSAFRIPTSAGPGAAHWHDPARGATRYRILADLGYRYVLALTDSEIEHAP